MFSALKNKAKQLIAVAAAVATIATTGMLYATDDAHADRRDFWGGVAAGAITGVLIGSAARHHRYERRHYYDRPVYVERRVYHRPHYRKRYYKVRRHHHRHYRNTDAHVNWCYNRYRSYDARSDTFQPYHGPRRYCNSPYN